MSFNLPDENLIREYLLGTLPEKDWNEIEEKLLSDKEFADFADSIEDEIIEEYLTIQNHFLRPPDRQRKLLFAGVLRSKLKKSVIEPVPIDRSRRQARPATRFYWVMGAAAAILLVSTLYLTVYTARLRDEVRTANANSRSEESTLAQLRIEKSKLESKLGSSENLIDLGATSRDGGQSRRHSVTPGTKSLRIRLSIEGPSSPSYSVELRTGDIGGEPRWSQDNLQPDSNALDFVIPYYGPGYYFFRLTRKGNHLSTDLGTQTLVVEQTQEAPKP
ncbi:MAG TPA: hypothetical protein VHA33_17055 [Candidatus Angelobacter sp.]|jgi:hypothetical protein|nr:hypothetical protein [Candidatus Angelobacter sp.]